MNKTVSLCRYSNKWYNPGNPLKRAVWHIISGLFVKSFVPYPNFLKMLLIKAFGAKIGNGVVIKPSVLIKYPWFLEIGSNVWIGEDAWIDNLAKVTIGSNVCISQGALIITGNHDYKKETFDLITEPVFIEDGVWIGARAAICPGVTIRSHSVITVGSVVTNDTEPYKVYQGNPARAIRERKIE